MRRLFPLIFGIAGCTLPQKPVPTTPTVVIPEVYLSSEEKRDYDSETSIEKIIAELKPTIKEAKHKVVMHYNTDSSRREERKVYRLQEPAVKIPIYKADVIISLRDVYHDGNMDLEIRVVPEEPEGFKMKVYRDLFPFGSLDEVDECGIEWDELERITYYPCSRVTNDDKEKRSFSNIINRLVGKWEDKVSASLSDYKYVESKYILERSEAIIHMHNFESPYR